MVKPTDKISDEAMQRLATLMNDSPSIVKLNGTAWEIKSLRPGTQWKIAELACLVVKEEKESMGDVITEFAKNMPVVCHALTCALLNDKRILNTEDGDYKRVFDTLMWGEYDIKDWVTLLFEILNLIDVDFFFASTDAIVTIRKMTLERKKRMKEQKSSPQEQNGGR